MKTVEIREFTVRDSGGNPIQVVICHDGRFPEIESMRMVAGDNPEGETVFLINNRGRIELQTLEADGREGIWGNGTVAAFKALLEENLIKAGEDYVAHIGSEQTTIKVEKRFVSMTMPRARVMSTVSNRESVELIFKSLGIPYEAVSFMPACGCFRNLEPMVVTAGMPVLVVPVNGKDMLEKISPDMPLVSEICKGLKCAGIYAFAFETVDIGTMAHCRGFYPLLGVDESAASASAVAALSFYLNGFGLFPQGREALYFQKTSDGNESQITAFIKGKGASMEILIGGEASIKI